MVIYFGADHRGFKLKEILKEFLKEQGYEVEDMGNLQEDPADDFVDFATKVAEKVSANPHASRGILVCGSGAGMDITANKFPRVRSVLAVSGDQIFEARQDDDVNILTLAADVHQEEDAKKFTKTFLTTAFDEAERHVRRLNKISELENDA